jgi:hypothetical protein
MNLGLFLKIGAAKPQSLLKGHIFNEGAAVDPAAVRLWNQRPRFTSGSAHHCHREWRALCERGESAPAGKPCQHHRCLEFVHARIRASLCHEGPWRRIQRQLRDIGRTTLRLEQIHLAYA